MGAGGGHQDVERVAGADEVFDVRREPVACPGAGPTDYGGVLT